MSAKIFKGVAKTINCIARKKSDSQPFDLSGVTTMTSCFIRADGTSIDVNGLTSSAIVIGNTTLGEFTIALSASVTSVLAEGTKDFYVEADDGSTQTPIPYSNGVNVVAKPC